MLEIKLIFVILQLLQQLHSNFVMYVFDKIGKIDFSIFKLKNFHTRKFVRSTSPIDSPPPTYIFPGMSRAYLKHTPTSIELFLLT